MLCFATSEDQAETLATRMRTMRAERRWSQRELAKLAGVSRPTVAKLELGSGVATLKTLNRIAGAFGCSPGELLSASAARQ